MQDKHYDVTPVPPAVVDLNIQDVVGRFAGLSRDQRREIFCSIAPRILGRVQEVDRERFLDSLRHARVEAVGESGAIEGWAGDASQVIDEILDATFEEQLHLLRLTAVNLFGTIDAAGRERLIDDVESAIYGAQLQPSL